MIKQKTANPETRLSIRANASQKSLLARAASSRHMNISQFVLGVSLREAEQIIRDSAHIALSDDEYDWLVKFMDEPSDAPRLKDAFGKPAVWDV